MSEDKEPKKVEVKGNEAIESKPNVSDFKTHIKGTDLKLTPLKGTNAVKFDKNICYVRDTNYGISVWISVGKDANKTKQIKTVDQLVKFVDGLKAYVEKTKEEMKKEK